MSNSLIKINDTALDVAESLYVVQALVYLASKNYAEAYDDFGCHYLGDAEEQNAKYRAGLVDKVDVLAKFYGDAAYIIEEIYGDFTTIDEIHP